MERTCFDFGGVYRPSPQDETKIKQLITQMAGVQGEDVNVDMQNKRVTVKYDKSIADKESIARKLRTICSQVTIGDAACGPK
ncbi:hypothetical protein SUGI_0103120 [Cryptomeria japonica]|nr:hypothetical protein SUGI_0103120 [Cryptomeria japonica]